MKYKLFYKLSNNISILCSKDGWVLDSGDKNNRQYHSYLDGLLDDLLETRILANALGSDTKKDVSSIIDFIETTRVQVREDIEAIKNTLINADAARGRGDFG